MVAGIQERHIGPIVPQKHGTTDPQGPDRPLAEGQSTRDQHCQPDTAVVAAPTPGDVDARPVGMMDDLDHGPTLPPIGWQSKAGR